MYKVVCKETEMKAACSEADALENNFLPWNREKGKNPLSVGLFWGWGEWFYFFFLELLNKSTGKY